MSDSSEPIYESIDEIPPIPEPFETEIDYGDFPPPPPPNFSRYLELQRDPTPENAANTLLSQGPADSESMYEPISPPPQTNLSLRTNYSPYASHVKGSKIPHDAKDDYLTPKTFLELIGSRVHHEAEVDALTDSLIQSMDSPSTESNSFGDCCECGGKVVEGNGCTAMDRIYHNECFTCFHCAIKLQGKPFYNLEGKPYCEAGYLQTLEKCSVCLKPILDRILRVAGRPYHPKCFCCVVCGKSLDGIPFTVDATNQIHCIEDFHKKFAPRCCVCQLPIMPEPGQDETVRVVALDRSFHIACYKCEDCGLLLSSEAEGRGCYPLDDHVLCKSCNAKRVQALTSHMKTELTPNSGRI